MIIGKLVCVLRTDQQTDQPTNQLANQPTNQPSIQPTNQPTDICIPRVALALARHD